MSAYLDRAMLLLGQSRFDLADQELRRLLAADPDDATAHALLAVCLDERDRHEEAIHEAEQAIRLAPGMPFAHYVLAKALLHRKLLPASERALEEAIRLDPEDADYFGLLAAIRMEQRRWDDARRAAEQGLAIAPEHTGCANLRAMALVQLGRKGEAAEAIRGALARDPDNALSHANQGWTLLHQGEHRRALEHFREALRIDPELEWARAGIVEALKARHLLYRVMLAYFLWMSRAGARMQWVVILGIFFAPSILGEIGRAEPRAKPFVALLTFAVLFFAYLTWVADPLFNLLLRVNKFGRYALSRPQVVASNWVGLCVLGALIVPISSLALSPVLGLVPGLLLGLLALIYFLLLILPVAATFRCRPVWPRVVMAGYTVGLAAIGLAFLGGVLVREVAPAVGGSAALLGLATATIPFGQYFLVGVVLSTWVAAFLTRAY